MYGSIWGWTLQLAIATIIIILASNPYWHPTDSIECFSHDIASRNKTNLYQPSIPLIISIVFSCAVFIFICFIELINNRIKEPFYAIQNNDLFEQPSIWIYLLFDISANAIIQALIIITLTFIFPIKRYNVFELCSIKSWQTIGCMENSIYQPHLVNESHILHNYLLNKSIDPWHIEVTFKSFNNVLLDTDLSFHNETDQSIKLFKKVTFNCPQHSYLTINSFPSAHCAIYGSLVVIILLYCHQVFKRYNYVQLFMPIISLMIIIISVASTLICNIYNYNSLLDTIFGYSIGIITTFIFMNHGLWKFSIDKGQNNLDEKMNYEVVKLFPNLKKMSLKFTNIVKSRKSNVTRLKSLSDLAFKYLYQPLNTSDS